MKSCTDEMCWCVEVLTYWCTELTTTHQHIKNASVETRLIASLLRRFTSVHQHNNTTTQQANEFDIFWNKKTVHLSIFPNQQNTSPMRLILNFSDNYRDWYLYG